jgi:hypothetical protein
MTYLAVAILFAVLLLLFSTWKEKGLLLGTVAPHLSPAQWTSKRQLWSVLTTIPQLLLFFVMANFVGWYVAKAELGFSPLYIVIPVGVAMLGLAKLVARWQIKSKYSEEWYTTYPSQRPKHTPQRKFKKVKLRTKIQH